MNEYIKKTTVSFFTMIIFFSVIISGCSSAPKRAMVVTTIADNAYSLLEQANMSMAKGNYIEAKSKTDEAYQKGLSIDNVDLLTKVCLTKVTLAVATQTSDNDSAKLFLDEATTYAKHSTNADFLLSVCSLYEARLILNACTESQKFDDKTIDDAFAMCNSVEPKVSKDAFYLAYLYRTRGEIYIVKENFDQAQKEFVAAANLHTKARYLSEIGLDWYYAARAYSRQGKKQEALESLDTALQYDRLDENTAGIGADYYGMAEVLLKNAPTEEEKKSALYYASYSAQIYKAGGYSELAQKSVDLVMSIK
jgi:tetratricopeptide (TPR) repeat protein